MTLDLKKILNLDDDLESKIATILLVLSMIMFVIWAFHVKGVYEMGYKDGIKECFMNQDFFVEMTKQGKMMYGGFYFHTNMTVEEMMEILNQINTSSE